MRQLINWDDLRTLYEVERLSTREIADRKGTQRRFVRKNLNKQAIKIRSRSEGQLVSWEKGNRKPRLKGQDHSAWKGGRSRDKHGYVRIYCPDHPYSDKKGYVYEHRLVMEKLLGRYLMPWEVVHHKGERYPLGSIQDKGDNRPENLHVYSCQAEHLPSILVTRRLHKLEGEVVELRKQNRFLLWTMKELRAALQEKLILERNDNLAHPVSGVGSSLRLCLRAPT